MLDREVVLAQLEKLRERGGDPITFDWFESLLEEVLDDRDAVFAEILDDNPHPDSTLKLKPIKDQYFRLAHSFPEGSDWRTPVRALLDKIPILLKEIKVLRDDVQSYDWLTNKQSKILRNTINLLRETPPEHTWWSVHDVDAVAQVYVDARNELEAAVNHADWDEFGQRMLFASDVKAILNKTRNIK